MYYDWSSVKRYSATGWKYGSLRFFLGVLALVIIVSLLGSAPFWVTFPSIAPLLVLYFPILGFFIETMEKDWKDWHLW
ncbi:MAG: hypothetical protein P1S46_01205 [bacterium]|nr:hypothetical protein [bacterium]